jgi:ABC-type transporter lipoprotein component MlaA
VGGVIDVARRKPFRLPRRPNGFANTLGFYGVKPGPFLFLPLIGPTTVRDLVGLSIDRMVLPSTIGAPFNQPTYTTPATIVGSLDYRAEFDTQLQAFKDSPDPYAASRAHYLAGRQAEIDALRGRVLRSRSIGEPTCVALMDEKAPTTHSRNDMTNRPKRIQKTCLPVPNGDCRPGYAPACRAG